MFKIIRTKKYKSLLKEIKELKEPKDIITIEAKENIDKLYLIPTFESACVKRNVSIALAHQILKDESLIRYYMVSNHPNMLFAEIRIIKPKNFNHES